MLEPRKPGPERDLPRRRRRVAGLARGLGGARARDARAGAVRLRRRRRRLRGDDPREPRGVRAAPAAAADARRQRRARPLGRGARAALAGAVPARADRRALDRPPRGRARRRARARSATGVPMILSSAASTSLEDVAAELGDAPRWFQLYWWGDRELAGSLVDRAERGRLRRDRRHARHADARLARRATSATATCPSSAARGCAQFFSDPLFRARLDAPPEEDLQTASLMALAAFPNLALTWDDLAWLRERTDAADPRQGRPHRRRRAARARARRRRDRRLQPRRPPGRRRGRLARRARRGARRGRRGRDGADGRRHPPRRGRRSRRSRSAPTPSCSAGPTSTGSRSAAQPGVEAVIRQLAAELDLTMALAGVRSVRELDRTAVT